MSDPDVQLMLRVREGDADAFRELFEKHKRAIVNFAYHFIGNRQRAEEIAQDVFLQIYRAAVRYEPTAKFTTWLYRIATNACLNEVRRPSTAIPSVPSSISRMTIASEPKSHSRSHRRAGGQRLGGSGARS